MSPHEEELTGEVGIDTNEGNKVNSVRFSPDKVDERIKANLKPLHAQISALTEMMDSLTQGNSAREFTTASTRALQSQLESPFTGAPGTSSFPTVAPLTTAGYSPDTAHEYKLYATLQRSCCQKSLAY